MSAFLQNMRFMQRGAETQRRKDLQQQQQQQRQRQQQQEDQKQEQVKQPANQQPQQQPKAAAANESLTAILSLHNPTGTGRLSFGGFNPAFDSSADKTHAQVHSENTATPPGEADVADSELAAHFRANSEKPSRRHEQNKKRTSSERQQQQQQQQQQHAQGTKSEKKAQKKKRRKELRS